MTAASAASDTDARSAVEREAILIIFSPLGCCFKMQLESHLTPGTTQTCGKGRLWVSAAER